MARVITEETFNEVVEENMKEFDMTRDEAVQDAIKQFEAQGVDLSNILKAVATDLLTEEETAVIDDAYSKLEGSFYVVAVIELLKVLKKECEKSIPHRVYVGKKGLYTELLDILHRFPGNAEVKNCAFETLASLMTDQPDLLNGYGVFIMATHLENEKDLSHLETMLPWMKVCCIKHEQNRQDIIDAGVVSNLTALLNDPEDRPNIVRGVCTVSRALVLDDDICVEFSNSHKHAQAIAEGAVTRLVELLKKYEGNKEVTGDLLLTLSVLLVRNEFCETLADAADGLGLAYILNVFTEHPDSEKLNRVCLKLLKVLAGSDKVKSDIIKMGAAPTIVSAIERFVVSSHYEYLGCTTVEPLFKSSYDIVAAGYGSIAALTLRSPSNSKAFCDAGAHTLIVEGMNAHALDLSVQKQGCWAIRNIVSRSRELIPLFLELGAEDLLNRALELHGKSCDYDVKAALRDLGCKVDLREEWTGQGGALN